MREHIFQPLSINSIFFRISTDYTIDPHLVSLRTCQVQYGYISLKIPEA